MTNCSEQINLSSDELSKVSQNLAAGCSEQAAGVEETSSAIIEIEDRANGNHEKSTQAQTFSNETIQEE